MELNKTFTNGLWNKEINVSDFVSKNIAPYTGDASFLQGPTERTKRIWDICLKALEEERNNNGVRSLDNTTVSTITSHKAGYIDKDNELIVGLQTDELLKRSIKPFGGINVVAKACRENGVEVDDKVKDIFTHYRKTHNDGVFDVYTEEIRSFRSLGFLTGLPDNYARGRIIGDYRRLALYGIDRLIEAKQEDLRNLTGDPRKQPRSAVLQRTWRLLRRRSGIHHRAGVRSVNAPALGQRTGQSSVRHGDLGKRQRVYLERQRARISSHALVQRSDRRRQWRGHLYTRRGQRTCLVAHPLTDARRGSLPGTPWFR